MTHINSVVFMKILSLNEDSNGVLADKKMYR